ncbi:MmcQ/YjbR family DNA-binding protein [Anaerobacillus sp. HL2]|nr:MmcQ/YjbR family DNA-binding protein [Anaerobacillus sp. HL2]
MDQNSLKEYCLSQKGAVETFPFGEQAAVYKIGTKMFALINLEEINENYIEM